RAFMTTGNVPEFGAVVQIEGNNCSRCFGCLHAFDDDFGGCLRKRRKNSAAVKPAHTAGKNFFPIKITWLEQGARFVATIVKNHRRPDALAAVAVNGGHVRSVNAIMLEMFVDGFHSHGTDALGYQVADGIIDHRSRDGSLHLEAIRKVGCDVEFASANVDIAMGCFAKWDDAGIEAMDQRAERA